MDPFQNFNTTLVKVHLRQVADYFGVSTISIQPLLRFIVFKALASDSDSLFQYNPC